MRILHIHDFFAPGNSRYGHDLCRFLVRRGHEVHVLAGVGPLGPRDGAQIDGVHFHTYPYGFKLGGFKFLKYAVRQNKECFEHIVQDTKIDLLLFNQPLCFHGVTQSRGAREIPKIYSFISPWALEWEIAHRGSVRSAAFSRAWGHFWNTRLRRYFERKALKQAQRVIVISNFMRAKLLEQHPRIPEEKLIVIPGAVDSQHFSPSEQKERGLFSLDDRVKVLVTLRRLVPRMGLENLILAMPKIKKEFPETVLLIGGDGPLRLKLQELVDSLGYAEHIRFWGYVSDSELPTFYRAADVFILPTRELEGFGLVALEAMACGTPVLATPVGAIPEVLKPFSPEVLFTGTQPDDIAQGVINFFRSPSLKGTLQKQCRNYVVKNYSWDYWIGQIERLFEQVASGKSG